MLHRLVNGKRGMHDGEMRREKFRVSGVVFVVVGVIKST